MKQETSFGLEETAEEKVQDFLAISRDTQAIHLAPTNLMPGMFYVALAASYINREIKGINTTFTGMRFYPFNGNIKIDEEIQGDRIKIQFDFYDSEGPISQVTFFTGNKPQENNENKLNLTYRVAGYLLEDTIVKTEIPEEKVAIYNSQSIGFNGYAIQDIIPPIIQSVNSVEKNKEIPMIWEDKGEVIAIGTANVRTIGKNISTRMLESVKRALNR